MNTEVTHETAKAWSVQFLDKNDETRSFIEFAPTLDIATENLCEKLQSTPFFRIMSKDFMHIQTVEVT